MRINRLSRSLSLRLFVGLAIAVAAIFCADAQRRSSAASTTTNPSRSTATSLTRNARYGQLPLSFEANRGQADRRVKFLARGHNSELLLTANEAVLALNKTDTGAQAAVRMHLVGADAKARVSGQQELISKSNYFIGRDPRGWLTDVPNFGKVKYTAVYPGIDVVYYGNEGKLEYDFLVAPGADPKRITMKFDGANGMRLAENGDLVLNTKAGEMRHRRPVIYQEVNGVRQNIEGRYVMRGHEAGFELGPYDASRPLVIDPVLVYSTFLGGGQGYTIKVDSAGCAYILSDGEPPLVPFSLRTVPTNFRGSWINVVKLSADGASVLYSAVVSGSQFTGSSSYAENRPKGLALDAAGNVYITGETNCVDFPTTPGVYRPNFSQQLGDSAQLNSVVFKLNAAGNQLLYSTFFATQRETTTRGIDIDTLGNVYLAGYAGSDFPVTAGGRPFTPSDNPGESYDAFVAKLNPTGTALVFANLIGGKRIEVGWKVKVDAGGNVYVVGTTGSTQFHETPFPITPGAYTIPYNLENGSYVFLAKFGATGGLLFSTVLGPSAGGQDEMQLAVNLQGQAYAAGVAVTHLFPTTPGAFQTGTPGADQFRAGYSYVVKMNAAGTAPIYSTYFGGGQTDVWALEVDAAGNAYVGGMNNAAIFPAAAGSINVPLTGAFVARLNASGRAMESYTLLGPGTTRALALDAANNVYATGDGRANFPTTAGAFKRDYVGRDTPNVFVAKLTAGTTGVTAVGPTVTPTPTPTPVPTPVYYAIGGRITERRGVRDVPVADVMVTLSGGLDDQVKMTDANGDFTFSDVLGGGNYLVVPAKSGYVGAPVSAAISNLSAARTANFSLTATQPLFSVSSASYVGTVLARESIVTAFGANLATGTQAASGAPPLSLAGTTVKVCDSRGVERAAPLFFVSPTQVNFLLPADTANGMASIIITSSDGKVSSSAGDVAAVAPGFFSADASGSGLAAAIVLRVKANGAQSYEPIARFDSAQSRMVAIPIDLGDASDQVFLVLFGTGMRNRSGSGAAVMKLGGVSSTTTFIGPQGNFAGLDQVNVPIPRSLIGRGEVDVTMTLNGRVANTVKATIK